jgi:hypothetical protein
MLLSLGSSKLGTQAQLIADMLLEKALSIMAANHDEALANIREAIALCLDVRAERGLPVTIETRQIEVTF